MNVAHLVFSFENGGIENLLVDILNNWPENEKIILCIVNDLKSNELLSKIMKRKNVLLYELNRKPSSNSIESIRILKMLYSIIKKHNINVVHCHSHNVFKYALLIKILCPNIKFFLTIHATNIYSNISSFNMFLEKAFLRRIFAISLPVKDEIIKRGFPVNRVDLIYNATDSKKFIIHKKDSNPKKIVCIARLVPRIKGQDILVKALFQLKKIGSNFKCYLVGSEPNDHPEYKEQINQLINEYNLQDDVFLLGNRNDVPNLLSKSDIFVLPSREEGFGISVIEAMLSKVLVIVSDIEALKDLVGNNQYGYVFESENVSELSKILDLAIKTDNTKMIDNAYDYALNHYDIKKMINVLYECYKK